MGKITIIDDSIANDVEHNPSVSFKENKDGTYDVILDNEIKYATLIFNDKIQDYVIEFNRRQFIGYITTGIMIGIIDFIEVIMSDLLDVKSMKQ